MRGILVALALLAAATARAGDHIECNGYPLDGTTWTFEIYADAKDAWDSEKAENPPLSAKKAKELATAFMKRVPFGDKMLGWTLSTITLHRITGEPEQWIYEVHFDGMPPGPDWNGSLPWFTVLVRMDGSIPDPKISKPVSKREELEKANRPDLWDGASAHEKTLAHQAKMQLTADELKTMPTDTLVNKVCSSSLLIMMIMEPEPDGGLANYSQSYNGVAALLGREDAGTALLKEYRRITSEVPTRKQSDDPVMLAENGRFVLRFTVIEVMLSSDDVLKRMTTGEMKSMMSSVVAALDARRKHDATLPRPLYGEATLEYTGLPMAKCMARLRVPAYERWMATKSGSGLFVSRPLTYPEAQEVVGIARAYLAEK